MNIRDCKVKDLNTGASGCPYDRENITGAIIVAHGHKLPETLDGSTLEEACHADRPNRVMPVVTFVEYTKNGGEPQVSQVGYGPNKVTGVSALTDTYTFDGYPEMVCASLSRSMNAEVDAYFFDKNNVIYGYNDGTDSLAGFPMSCVYPTMTPHPTSGAKATATVSFCYKDARDAFENADFKQLDFNIATFAYGLTPVKFVKTAANKYKIVEVVGGYDRTAEFGSTIATSPTTVLEGAVTGVSYDEAENVITMPDNTVPVFKKPSLLYTAGVKGIVGV